LKNETESQLENIKNQLQNYYGRMRKRLPLLEFNLLNQLRR